MRNTRAVVLGLGMLTSGVLLGFGVHLAMGDDNNPPDFPDRSDAAVLDKFNIQTDTAHKKVEVRLYGQTQGQAAIQKSGKQLNIELPMTRLSQSLLDNGLPVVIDNSNKFIGRAVPGQNPHQSRIIIPNFPTNDYDVSVVYQAPNGKTTTLTRAAAPEQAPLQMMEVTQQPAPQRTTSAATSNDDQPDLRPRQAAPAARPSYQAPPQTAVSAITPRPAVSGDTENTFEAIAETYKMPGEVARPRTAPRNATAVNTASPWSRMKPVSVSSNTDTNEETKPAAKPASASYPIWNPYVVQTAPNQAAEAVPDLTTDGQNFNRIYSSGPSSMPKPDPLWYLHQLPSRPTFDGTQSVTPNTTIALTPMPDFSKPIKTLPFPAVKNAKDDNSSLVAAPTVDKSLIATLKQLIHMVPTWVYVVLGLFLLGIGLFTLVAAASILFQLFKPGYGAFQKKLPLPPSMWQVQRNKYRPPVQKPAAAEIPSPVASSVPRHSNLAVPEVVFDDVPSLNAFRLLKDTPHTMREAVQKSVLLKFPTHRPRGNARKMPV